MVDAITFSGIEITRNPDDAYDYLVSDQDTDLTKKAKDLGVLLVKKDFIKKFKLERLSNIEDFAKEIWEHPKLKDWVDEINTDINYLDLLETGTLDSYEAKMVFLCLVIERSHEPFTLGFMNYLAHVKTRTVTNVVKEILKKGSEEFERYKRITYAT